MRALLKLMIWQMKSKNYSENIIKFFKKDGFVLSEPDVLLDSDYIIQRSGESFRKLMLTFEDDSGKSMCLKPDLTVASCIKYLKDNPKSFDLVHLPLKSEPCDPQSRHVALLPGIRSQDKLEHTPTHPPSKWEVWIF